MGESAARAEVRVEARAKVNLFLRVLGRRDDGYHDLESLVVPVSLSDTVIVRADAELSFGMRPAGSIQFEPIDPRRNLAFLAAEDWVETRWTAGEAAEVIVEKRIPVAAGLGGGSADAAAVLRGMNEVWGEPFGPEELATMGARIGSDVPALLDGGAVVMRGRGEIVEPATVAQMWWVLVPQPFPVSTADVYRWWDEDGGPTGPNAAPLLEAAAVGDVDALAGLVFNDLQGPVFRRHPELEEVRSDLLRAGALRAILCGSGPTVAGLARDEAHARAVAARIPSAIAVSGPG